MRPSIFLLAAFFSLAIAAPAFALSIDNETGMNSDGSAKFSDPDDQQPSMLNTPLHEPSSSSKPDGMLQVTPGTGMSFSGGAMGQPQQQQDAFDHAYQHFGN